MTIQVRLERVSLLVATIRRQCCTACLPWRKSLPCHHWRKSLPLLIADLSRKWPGLSSRKWPANGETSVSGDNSQWKNLGQSGHWRDLCQWTHLGQWRNLCQCGPVSAILLHAVPLLRRRGSEFMAASSWEALLLAGLHSKSAVRAPRPAVLNSLSPASLHKYLADFLDQCVCSSASAHRDWCAGLLAFVYRNLIQNNLHCNA